MTDIPEDAPPDPRMRPADDDLREFARPSTWDLTPMKLVGAEICRELLAARALLADLKAEGCPWVDEPETGRHVCAYCGGPEKRESAERLNVRIGARATVTNYFEGMTFDEAMALPAERRAEILAAYEAEMKANTDAAVLLPIMSEPEYDHRPMEDGKPCLWVRIQGT